MCIFVFETDACNNNKFIFQVKDYTKDHPKYQKLLQPIIKKFDSKLKEEQYYACYFDRHESIKSFCMCDSSGWFDCEGAYNVEDCCESHRINPYGSLTERITFSTWNLDHR